MKKFLVVSAMVASLIAVAGPKADIEKANKLFSENKVEEAVKVLKASKVTKGEELEYELINYTLATDYAKTPEEAVSYFKKAAANKKSTSTYAISANYQLAALAKTNKEKIAYFEELRARVDDVDVEMAVAFIQLYTEEKETKKLSEIEKFIATKGQDYKDSVDLNLGKSYLETDQTKANMYLNKAVKSKIAGIRAEVYYTYGVKFFNEKDKAKGKSYFAQALKEDPKNLNLMYRMAYDYTILGDYKEGFDLLKKMETISPEGAPYQDLFVLATLLNSSDEAKYAKILKTKFKVEDIRLASALQQSNLYDQSIKYAKSSKAKEASYILALAYAGKGDKKEAVKYAEKAVKDKVEGAKELLKEIQTKLK